MISSQRYKQEAKFSVFEFFIPNLLDRHTLNGALDGEGGKFRKCGKSGKKETPKNKNILHSFRCVSLLHDLLIIEFPDDIISDFI